jgi:hypothetical protein
MYVNHYSKPDSFEHGVALLRIDKGIQNKIGDFDSYTYFDKDLPNKKDNPAYFKVSLKGSIATIYLTCKMKKDTLGQWRIIEIKQDSLSKNSISE